MPEVRFPVRVRPGASRTKVGGVYGEDQLVVAVTQRAVDGKATEACLRAVARALELRAGDLWVVSGAHHRTKVLAVDLPEEAAAAMIRTRLERLRVSE